MTATVQSVDRDLAAARTAWLAAVANEQHDAEVVTMARINQLLAERLRVTTAADREPPTSGASPSASAAARS